MEQNGSESVEVSTCVELFSSDFTGVGSDGVGEWIPNQLV